MRIMSKIKTFFTELRPNIIWDVIKFVGGALMYTFFASGFLTVAAPTISMNLVVVGGLFFLSLLLLGGSYFFQNRQKKIDSNQKDLAQDETGTSIVNKQRKSRSTILVYGFTGLVLVGLLASSFAVGRLSASANTTTNFNAGAKMVEVKDKNFSNEMVLLDGYSYEDCKFTNVKLVYNGTTRPKFKHNTFVGSIEIASESPTVNATFAILKGIGMIDPDIPFNDSNGKPLERVKSPKFIYPSDSP